jgi:hypothetical protein
MFNPLRQSTALPSLNRPIRPSIRMEEPAIYEATLRVKQPFQSTICHREDTELRVAGERIDLLCRDVHEVIEITLNGD